MAPLPGSRKHTVEDEGCIIVKGVLATADLLEEAARLVLKGADLMVPSAGPVAVESALTVATAEW